MTREEKLKKQITATVKMLIEASKIHDPIVFLLGKWNTVTVDGKTYNIKITEE